MMLHKHLIPHNKALGLILAGNATFTLRNSSTGKRFTYKIQSGKSQNNKHIRYIKLLCGGDNNTNYQYFGCFKLLNLVDFDLMPSFDYNFGIKTKLNRNSEGVQAFEKTIILLRAQRLNSIIEIWHEGKCMRCGRKLTDPTSIKNGLGPECIQICELPTHAKGDGLGFGSQHSY